MKLHLEKVESSALTLSEMEMLVAFAATQPQVEILVASAATQSIAVLSASQDGEKNKRYKISSK